MTIISVKDFVKKTVKANPGTNAAELTESCKAVLDDKRNGAVCQMCGGRCCDRYIFVLHLHDRRSR